MIPEIKALCAPPRHCRRHGSATSSAAAACEGASDRSTGTMRVLAIGASTGGPNALAEIFAQLPADFPVPIVIVQHMPPMFTRLLAERLSAQSAIRVQEASSGCVLKPGHAWIAPGDHHMIVVRDGLKHRLLVHQDPPENSCRPAVDVLLRSRGQDLRPRLAERDSDRHGPGRTCAAASSLREAGGQILVQDEATSVVWGMPGTSPGRGWPTGSCRFR